MNFDEFGLHHRVLNGVVSEGYKTPTPVQVKAIPAVLEGLDVMGLAQTGTGKTAAFMLPILDRLMTGKLGRPRALIVAPTRELAEQIHQAAISLGRHTRSRSLTMYGGVGFNPQVDRLRRGAEIVVGCPGRILDHIRRGTVDFSGIEVVVLDEADHMFDMGFLPDIRRILGHLPTKRQTLMFSATMPPDIRDLANEMLVTPAEVRIGMVAPADSVRHALFPVDQKRKTALLMALLKKTDIHSALVFTSTKHMAKRLGVQLSRAGFRAASIQGDLSQNRRQATMNGFRDGNFQILVATDIVARGIDVSKVSHVINYDVPRTPEIYIHRIGRTGRASESGEAYTLFTNEDRTMVRAIDRVLGSRVERRTVEGFEQQEPVPMRNNASVRPGSHSRKTGYQKRGNARPQRRRANG